MATMGAFSGGEALQAKLKEIIKKAEADKLVNVGFFPESTEQKTGVSTAYVAACNEFGGTVPARTGVNGDKIEAQKRPARPFFRRMIQHGSKHWGDDLARALKQYGYNTTTALESVGEQMVAELQGSIADNVYAPLKQSTIDRKGNDQTLIDSGNMQNAVQSKVE